MIAEISAPAPAPPGLRRQLEGLGKETAWWRRRVTKGETGAAVIVAQTPSKYALSESFTHRGERHVARLGKNISRAVAGELARVQRGAILKDEAGIGGPKRADLTIEKAAEEFLAGTKANKRLRTQRTYGQCVERLKASFAGRRLSEISAFDLERDKRGRVNAGVTVMVNPASSPA
jgi:hypothetical protein